MPSLPRATSMLCMSLPALLLLSAAGCETAPTAADAPSALVQSAPRLTAQLAMPISETEATALEAGAPGMLVRPDDGGGPLRLVGGTLFTERDVIEVGRRRAIEGVAGREILSFTLDEDAAARMEAATTPAGDGRRLQFTWDGETVSVPVVMGTMSTAGGIMADTATLDEIERVLRVQVG